MTDTEMLDWIAENVTTVRCDLVGELRITYLDEFGYDHEVSGDDIRDCIRKATK